MSNSDRANPKFNRAAVYVTMPGYDRQVEVKITPPDQAFDLYVNPGGDHLKVRVFPKGCQVAVRILGPDDDDLEQAGLPNADEPPVKPLATASYEDHENIEAPGLRADECQVAAALLGAVSEDDTVWPQLESSVETEPDKELMDLLEGDGNEPTDEETPKSRLADLTGQEPVGAVAEEVRLDIGPRLSERGQAEEEALEAQFDHGRDPLAALLPTRAGEESAKTSTSSMVAEAMEILNGLLDETSPYPHDEPQVTENGSLKVDGLLTIKLPQIDLHRGGRPDQDETGQAVAQAEDSDAGATDSTSGFTHADESLWLPPERAMQISASLEKEADDTMEPSEEMLKRLESVIPGLISPESRTAFSSARVVMEMVDDAPSDEPVEEMRPLSADEDMDIDLEQVLGAPPQILKPVYSEAPQPLAKPLAPASPAEIKQFTPANEDDAANIFGEYDISDVQVKDK